MSDMKRVPVSTRAWHGDTPLDLTFPGSWDVILCHMKGHAAPPLDEAGLRAAFQNPIGTDPLHKLARGKKEVGILIDDMTRPTQIADFIPMVLEELKAAGIKDESIRFMMALGAHGAYTRTDFVKKLGEDVVARYPVYNHNLYENCTLVGKTSRGTRVTINAEVAACDLKIGIGCIVPHVYTGFGGGAKILLPGISSMETIEANHESLRYTLLQTPMGKEIGLGRYERNPVRLDMVEAARLAGLDVIVNALVNVNRQTTALFVGDVEEAFLAGARLGETHYATNLVEEANVVVANCYGKGSEAFLALPACLPFFSFEPAKDFVVVVSAPEGQVTHYMYGPFGRDTMGRHFRKRPAVSDIPGLNRMIVFSSAGDKAGENWIRLEGSKVARTWSEVLQMLKETYGDRAKVAVVPDATIQYFPGGQKEST
jgi:nickel-dependent lactate racemase